MSMFTIRMVADTTDKDTMERLKNHWNFLTIPQREKLLTKMGHSTKYAEMKFKDLSGEVQSKIFMKNVTV